MIFWVVAVALTLCASLAVLLPLTGRSREVAAAADHDLEVYRDQLAELDRDVARGAIPLAEAEQARAEIGRRIIRIGRSEKNEAQLTTSATGPLVRRVSAAAVLTVPLVSWGLYAGIGSPDLPSQPLAARLQKNPAQSTVDELVARAESHLAANPNDGRGWDVLAPIYVRMQRYSDAAAAYRHAIRLLGSTAARQSGLGEALANAAQGMVTADAQAAFEVARSLDPANPKANFYLALALAQEGRKDDAKAAWQAMFAELPSSSPWRQVVAQALAQTGENQAGDAGKMEPTGEAAADAAASMSEEDRNAMIETMVAGLDERLRNDPLDEDGWMKLMRSYLVLGRKEQAEGALKRGVEAFGGESEQARKLAAFGESLGLSLKE